MTGRKRLGKYHHCGRDTQRRVTVPNGDRLGSEHLITIWELYTVDRMSLADIAKLYRRSITSIHGILCRINSALRQDGSKYISRLQSYAAALKLLETKPRMTYRSVAHSVGLNTARVAEIAKRNNLER